MTFASIASIGADLVALAVLVGALYIRRHSRKDLMSAYVGVNVGVLAVTLLLATASVGAGLGLGLFGVLSIIRLRSTQLTQHEVAYFFAALALGLLGGIGAPLTTTAALMALVVASLWISDHPALLRRNRHQVIMIDHAITDETALTAHLTNLLGARIRSIDTQPPTGAPAPAGLGSAAALPTVPSPTDTWAPVSEEPPSYLPQQRAMASR